jgi:tetratricopeptide (TPR) repeat protein
VAFSDKIAAQEAQISALKKELESYRATSEETESAQQTAESTLSSYEIVLNMYERFVYEDMSDAAMVQELIKVNPDSLGTLGKERYETIIETVYPRYSGVIYGNALDNFEMGYYEEVIEDLSVLMKIDEGYDDGEAMYLLAQAYEKIGDSDNANVWYGKVQKNYPAALETEESEETVEEEYEE